MYSKKLLSILVLLFSSYSIYAQRDCGTMEYYNQQLIENPNLAQQRQAIEAQTNAYLAALASSGVQPQAVITIPVVFHVVYSNASQNISDAACLAQINQLNLDFARLNSDAGNTPTAFAAIAANTNIQFCLAQRDPDGNPSSGIERRSTSTSSFSTNNGIKSFASGGMNPWPADKYLNIWSGALSGTLLGYAQFPGGNSSTDGIVVLFSSVGSMLSPGSGTTYNTGRTATHEVGHWLNLNHIWGDDSGACSGSDNVGDTPNQSDSNFGCPSFPNTDACTASSPGVMFMNYMDYVSDNCMNMFSQGQSSRMNALFVSGGSRESLKTSDGCLPVVLPACSNVIAGTVSASDDTLCNGQIAILSLNGTTAGVSGITRIWQKSLDGISGWNGAPGSNSNITYTVQGIGGIHYYRCLISCASGNSDSTAAIAIHAFGISAVDNDSICAPGLTEIIAHGFGQINWYENNSTSTVLSIGDTLIANVLGDTIFYASVAGSLGSNYSVGPSSNSIGTGSNNTNLSRGLIFKPMVDVVLDSISFYPGGAGIAKVQLSDSITGAMIDTASFTINAGQIGQKVTVYLGFQAAANVVYTLTGTGSTIASFYRSNSGVSFPYTVPGIISITRSTHNTTQYNYFYDWKLHTGCNNSRVAIPIYVGPLDIQTISSADTICVGSAVVLSASGANEYTWNPGNIIGNTITVAPNTTTTYSVLGSVSPTCFESDSALIEVIAPLVLMISVSDDSICRGENITLIATGANSYTWSPSGTANDTLLVAPNYSSTYSVEGLSGSCTETSTANVSVFYPEFSASVKDSNTICKGDTATLVADGNFSFTWYPGTLTGSQVSVSPTSTKQYTVTATDSLGCTSTLFVTVFVSDCTGLSSVDAEEGIYIFPNPTRDFFSIKAKGFESEPLLIELYDLSGRKLFSQRYANPNSSFEQTISTEQVSSGMYLVKCLSGSKMFFTKLIKM